MNSSYIKAQTSDFSQADVDDSSEMSPRTILVQRSVITVEELHKHGSYDPPNSLSCAQILKQKCEPIFACSSAMIWNAVVSKLPILGWLPSYKWKEWITGDIIAGITVAIMQIPLGMAFALLAHIPPICGIYMAFYQVLIYAFFGTSHHCSMGAFAVFTLMTGKVVKEIATFPSDEDLTSDSSLFLNDTESLFVATTYTPIQVATVVCFTAGVWQLIIGILQLGSCSVFLSDMLVSGFTTAAGFHVFTSQIKFMLGLTVITFSGPFKIIYSYIEIFSSLGTINWAATIITICAVAILLIINELIKPWLAKRTKIPIPSELLIVVGATLASRYGNFRDNFNIGVIGTIPTGLPPAAIPPLELVVKVAADSLVIAVVSFAIDFSLAKIFAIRKGYKVDATQELYAHGISNIGSSFFACAPMSAALGRSLVQEAAGGITQLACFVSCGVLLIVLLFIGPFFEPLPKAILASVIAVSLKGMFMQVKDVINMWKISKIDSAVWLVTFSATIIINIEFGLLVGVLFSLLVLLVRNQSPIVLRLGKVPKTDLYLDVECYPEAKETAGLTILRILGTIHFANRDNLKHELRSKYDLYSSPVEGNCIVGNPAQKDCEQNLIVDISGISYVDTAGAELLAKLKTEYGKLDVSVRLVGISDEVLSTLKRCNALKTYGKYDLYHSIHDAYSHCYAQEDV